MGSVVEGQRHAGAVRQALSQAKVARQRRHHGREQMTEHSRMMANLVYNGSVRPDLDHWLPDPAVRVHHRRQAAVTPEALWEAAQTVRLKDTRMLGRLVRWRIPGLERNVPFDTLFRASPFAVLSAADGALVSGLVGRIWTLRRDYPQLHDPDEFRSWSTPGTVRVVLANWVEPAANGALLFSEARVAPVDREARVGLAAVRPLVSAFQHLVGSEGIEAAVRQAERSYRRAQR
jgi:hypothetical protein